MNISHPRARAAIVFLLAILIIWFRAPDRLAHGFLWAEDANEFMLHAHQFGKRSIFLDYAGYLHLLPRLIAYGQFMLTPVAAAPYVFLGASLLITAAACAYIASAIRHPIGILLGLSLVLAPQQGEVLLSITNLQWMMFPCLLVLLWECLLNPPTSWVWPRVVVTAALALTGPFGVLLLPAAAVVAVWRRKTLSRAQIVWLAAYAAAALVQAWIMHTHPAYTPPPAPVDWPHRGAKELFTDLLPAGAPFWTGLALALWLMVIVAGSEAALAGAFICAVGIAVWALGAHRVSGYVQQFTWYGAGCRYLYIPILMFWWAALLSVVTAKSRAIASAAALFAGVIMLSSGMHFTAGVWPKWTITETAAAYDLTVPPNWSISIPR